MDSAGNFHVADYGNNRVLEYFTPYSGTGTPGIPGFPGDTTADVVFGQAKFTTNDKNHLGLNTISATSLFNPSGVALDSAGNLYVADFSNNRVLEYNTPLSTNEAAAVVFGQGGNFATNTANNGGISATSLFSPSGVVLDNAGNLYVADNSNNRVLEYNTPLTTDTTADLVFGQGGNFTTNTANNGGRSASSLNGSIRSGTR